MKRQVKLALEQIGPYTKFPLKNPLIAYENMHSRVIQTAERLLKVKIINLRIFSFNGKISVQSEECGYFLSFYCDPQQLPYSGNLG